MSHHYDHTHSHQYSHMQEIQHIKEVFKHPFLHQNIQHSTIEIENEEVYCKEAAC